MRFGLLYDDEVIDIYTPPAGKNITDCMPDDRASEYVSIPSHVTIGYTRRWDGEWVPPASPVPTTLNGESLP